MATLKLNSQTVVTESGGTLTAPALNVTTGTLASGVVFPAGQVIQTVQQATWQGTLASTGVTAFTATPNICSITPKKSTSKILVQVNQPYHIGQNTTSSDNGNAYEIWRDIASAGYAKVKGFTNGSTYIQSYHHDNDSGSSTDQAGSMSYSYLDSPASVALVSYRVYMGQWSARTQIESNPWGHMTTWVLQEIAQ